MKKMFLITGLLLAFVLAGIAWFIIGSKTIVGVSNPTNLMASLCYVIGAGCGGRLVTQPLPCFGTGAVWAKVLVAGVDAGGPVTSYIFWPTPFLYFLPTHVGQNFVARTTGRGFCATDPSNFRKGFTAPSSFFYGTSL